MSSAQGHTQQASASRLTRWDRAASSALRASADTLLDPVIILAATLFMLGASPVQIAIPAAITALVWATAPFVVPAIARLLGAIMPLAIAGVVLRMGAAILILAIGLRIQHLSPGDAVVAILLCYTFFQLGVALTDETWGSPWANGNGRRISAFGWVTLLTAIVSSLAGLAAARTLDPMRVNFPHSVGLLFVLGAIAALAAGWFLLLGEFMLTDDEIPDAASEPDARMQTSSGYRYLVFQALWSVSRLADPFVIVFALREMSLSFRYVGVALASYALLRGIGQLIAGSLPRALPPARMLQLGSFLRFIFLVVAGGISVAASSTWYQTEVKNSDTASWALACAFGALGVAVAFSDDAQRRYLGHLEGRAAQDTMRVSIPSVLLAILSISPLVGAWLVNRFSLEAAIVTGAIIAFLSMLASALLDMPIRRRRVKVRRSRRR